MQSSQHHPLTTSLPRLVLATAMLSLAASAGAPASAHPGHAPGTPPASACAGNPKSHASCAPPHRETALDRLNRAVAGFHSFDVALAAGWDAPISDCVEAPMGGMGFHYANIDELENGTLSLLRPEVLLYGPTEDGSMAFLGVEYIIPGPAWPSTEPPQFLGRELHYNPELDIWALHVWVGRHNPDGIFADFNPDVGCEHAG